MDKELWVRLTTDSIAVVSRTAKGVGDVSQTVGKPKLLVADGDALMHKASENIRQAIERAWNARDQEHFTAQTMQDFLNGLADTLNDGLYPPDRPKLRMTETKYAGPVHPSLIPYEYRRLCGWLAENTTRIAGDSAIRVAARAEQQLNRHVHPFADSCGRVSRLLGSWILLRGKLGPSQFPSYRGYYDAIQLPEAEWQEIYRSYVVISP